MLLPACSLLEINAAAMSLGLSIVLAVIVMKVGSRSFVNLKFYFSFYLVLVYTG